MAVSKQQFRFARSHDGVRLAWATVGAGPPLIKVATWLSHLEYDIDSPSVGSPGARAVAARLTPRQFVHTRSSPLSDTFRAATRGGTVYL